MHVKPGFTGQNGIIPTDSWIMTCDPLFDCIFREDSESVLGLVKFDHFTGQMYVKPGVTVQIWQKPPRINESWHLTPCSIVFFETISNMCLVWSNSVISSVKCTSNRIFTVRYGKNLPRLMINDMWPLIQLHFLRGFRIIAQFGLIQSNYRSNIRRTGFYWSEMAKVPK